MNSKKLRESFPEIYKSFFSSSQKVVSAPHSFFWTGDFSGFYGGLTILSKLPLRFYVGLEKIKQNKLDIDEELFAYFPAKDEFVKIKLDAHILNQLNILLKDKLKNYRIHFLSEASLGLSLGGLGALSACLSELINQGKDFETKFSLARTFAKSLQQGRPSGATAFASLTDSAYPVIYYSKGESWWGKTLDEVAGLKNDPIWPIDFGLIFSGNLVQGASVIASAEEIMESSKEDESKIKKLIKKAPGSFLETYINMLDQISYKCLLSMRDLLKSGTVERNLEAFFDTLNQYQNLLHFIGVTTRNINRIYSSVHKMASNVENQIGSGCKITGVGKGGEVLFAVSYGEYRDKIPALTENLKQKLNSNINLDYLSSRDGIEGRGTKVEQDLKLEIFSEFVKGDTYLVTIFEDNSSNTFMMNQDEITNIKSELIIDLESSKILYKNRKVNSSEIPSQKATVEIINKLLNSKDRKITNKKLPKSYSTNRFDVQSKITTPLQKLTGLNLQISGQTFENFTIFIKHLDSPVCIIKKIR